MRRKPLAKPRAFTLPANSSRYIPSKLLGIPNHVACDYDKSNSPPLRPTHQKGLNGAFGSPTWAFLRVCPMSVKAQFDFNTWTVRR